MEMLHVILWMIYPYSVVAIVVMGLVWQYDMAKVFDNKEVELKTNRLLRKIVTCLIILSILSGIAVLFFSNISHEPQKLFNWVLSLLRLQPDMELIMNISILSQIHLLIVLTLLLVLSFTKYISYLFNPTRYLKLHANKKFNKL